jgi:hypothetical protein
MLIYFLILVSVGIEGGYNTPAFGFNNIHSGTAFAIFCNRHYKLTDITYALGTTFYAGDNPAYSLNAYGLRCCFSKNNWRFSPFLTCGVNYMNRKLHNAKEVGYGFNYGVGVLINFRSNNLRIYPGFYYEGITDFDTHGGFIGVQLGIGYEI